MAEAEIQYFSPMTGSHLPHPVNTATSEISFPD